MHWRLQNIKLHNLKSTKWVCEGYFLARDFDTHIIFSNANFGQQHYSLLRLMPGLSAPTTSALQIMVLSMGVTKNWNLKVQCDWQWKDLLY